MILWGRKNLNISERYTNATLKALSSFNTPLIIFSENEKISEDLISERIRCLLKKADFKSTEILIFFDSFRKEKGQWEAISFWKVWFNSGFLPIDAEEQRKRFFDVSCFESRYKAFIIVSPFEGGAILNELISRIKNVHKNIFWLVNQTTFDPKQFLLVDELFLPCRKGRVRGISGNGLINIDIDESNAKSEFQDLKKTKIKEIDLVSFEQYSLDTEFRLTPKVKECVLEKTCLLFSENLDILRAITQERITSFSKGRSKVLVVCSSRFWNSNSNVISVNSSFLTTNYPSTLDENYSVVVCEDFDEDKKECIANCLKLGIKILVALKEKKSDILLIFKNCCQKFIFLDFDTEGRGNCKVFESTYLSINSEPVIVREIRLDQKVKGHILEKKCLTFSKSFDALRAVIQERIDTSTKNSLRVLVVSSLNTWKLYPNVTLAEPQALTLTTYSKMSTDFDSIIICDGIDKIPLNFVATCLREDLKVFVASWKESQTILSLFKENCQEFIFLNFDSNLKARVETFQTPLLSVDSTVNDSYSDPKNYSETKENLESEWKLSTSVLNIDILEDFSKPSMILAESEKVSESLAKEYIFLLTNKYGLLNKEIMISFSSLYSDRPFGVTSFWKTYQKFCNYDLYPTYSDNFKRKKIFDTASFESKYRAFIILAPFNCGPTLRELLSRIKGKHKKIIWLSTQKNFSEKHFVHVDSLFSVYGRYKAKSNKDGIYISEFKKEKFINDDRFMFSLFEKKDPFFDEVDQETEDNSEDIFATVVEKEEISDDFFEKEFPKSPTEVLDDFSNPLAILTENEQISEKLAIERISLMRNKHGLSSNQIMIAFSSVWKDNVSMEADSFWRTCENLCNHDLSSIYKQNQRKKIFDTASFENKYKALIIISPFDCNDVLKELISRFKDIDNVLWLACYPNLLEENFSLAGGLLSTYSKYKASWSGDRQNINIDAFSKRQLDNQFTSFFDEPQEEEEEQDAFFEDTENDPEYEDDPFFDETIEFKESDFSNSDDDIGGGLS